PAGARRGGDRRRHATSDWREVCDGKDRRRPRRRQPCPRPVAGIAGRLPERHLRRVPRPLATPGHRTDAMMEDLLRQWDGECVVVRYDHQTDTWIYIAIHDRTLGMAMGGCRMNVYPTPADGLKDALRLAHGMTYKWAAIGFPFGGGKSVLAVPRRLEGEEREGLLVRFGEIIEGLGGAYGGGVDLGTTPEDMNVIGRATSRAFGRTLDHGGAGDPGPWTALGVYAGIRVAVHRTLGSEDLDGHTILVQGLGGVGTPLAQRLYDGGARVLVSDTDEERARRIAEEVEGEVVAPEDVY